MEIKKAQAEAMKSARNRIVEVANAFHDMTGRKYGMIERYRMNHAELAVVVIGSSAGTGKAAVDKLRDQGIAAGLVKVRVFRPFPKEELIMQLRGVRAVAVMDKCEGFSGQGGPLFAETRSAMYDVAGRPKMVNYVYGLGGRDVTVDTFEEVFGELQKIAETGETGEVYRHIGVREE
jgi:pyruvate ferredoxin oxidoreductase alpha subunit